MTIPAGEKRLIVHFSAQRPPGDLAGVEALGQALVNGTATGIFAGIDPSDKARIVNFVQ